MSKELIIPVFIPHLGCGQMCVFCNQRKISGQAAIPTTAEIEREVLSYRASCAEITDREVQLAFYGGSFTGINEALQKEYLQTALKLKKQGLIDKIRLSTRADYINENIIARLLNYRVDIVELGVQSMDDEVLKLSKRGHSAAQVVQASRLLKQASLQLGLQMMIALPGDTPQKALETARRIISLEPDFVRIYPTAIIKDTELADMWQRGAYEPWDWEVLLDTAADIAALFQKSNIPIIRIGLQAADNLTLEQDLLGGAYHPAMGELVKGRLMQRKMEQILSVQPSARAYKVYCAKKQLSQVKGQKNCNVRWFAEKFQQRLYIEGRDDIPLDMIEIRPFN